MQQQTRHTTQTLTSMFWCRRCHVAGPTLWWHTLTLCISDSSCEHTARRPRYWDDRLTSASRHHQPGPTAYTSDLLNAYNILPTHCKSHAQITSKHSQQILCETVTSSCSVNIICITSETVSCQVARGHCDHRPRHCCMSHSDELPLANALSALQHHLSGTLYLSLFGTVTRSHYLNLDLKHICSPPSILLNCPVHQRLWSHGNTALYKFCIIIMYYQPPGSSHKCVNHYYEF